MDYISHHGIKGQRWGVRRWQNPDGSLTASGYIHYKLHPGDRAVDYYDHSGKLTSAGKTRRVYVEKKAEQNLNRSIAASKAAKYVSKAAVVASLAALVTAPALSVPGVIKIGRLLLKATEVSIGSKLVSEILREHSDTHYREFIELNNDFMNELEDANKK